MNPLTTGEVAQLFHLSKSTLRYYIDKELISSAIDCSNNYFLFYEADIYRLYQICLYMKDWLLNPGYKRASNKGLVAQSWI